VKEEVKSSNISVYPNPSTGKVTINSKDEILSIVVYSMHGKEEMRFTNTDSFNQIDINKKGLKLLVIETTTGTYSQRVVVE
jgi:hypothetical protein